jgi:hypothetical protein
VPQSPTLVPRLAHPLVFHAQTAALAVIIPPPLQCLSSGMQADRVPLLI